MIDEYGLVGDSWFDEMYDIRHSWIPAFYKDTPMSGLMKTTSRSESANAFFNIYVAWHFDLVEFLNNYDNAIEKQRQVQAAKENVTRTTYQQLVSPYSIELHAAKLYTRTIFFYFQKELKKCIMACGIEAVEVLGDLKTYTIIHKNKLGMAKATYKVVRSSTNNTVDCECTFFLRNGFFCRHALTVLTNEQVDFIPDQYVVRRWTQELVPVQFQSAKVRYGEVDAEKETLINGVGCQIDEIVSRIRNDKTLVHKLSQILVDFKDEIDSHLPIEDPNQQRMDTMKEYFGVPVPEDVDIFPPTGLRNKGCGTGK